jgi:nucleotide-binding universal stress UspA family protein
MKMGFPFKRILAPVDFDESSLSALDLAGKLARQNDATVSVLHIVPVDIDVRGMPQYTELIQRQESIDHDKLSAAAKAHLADVNGKLSIRWDRRRK